MTCYNATLMYMIYKRHPDHSIALTSWVCNVNKEFQQQKASNSTSEETSSSLNTLLTVTCGGGHGTANAVQRTEFLLHKVQVVLTVQEMGRMRKRGDDETLTDRFFQCYMPTSRGEAQSFSATAKADNQAKPTASNNDVCLDWQESQSLSK
ncbi:hypothetical protein HID58_021803 [Brassica napus]|uniref:Uncharacterized protein n=1 Tax=Brassica napus TaxID=3708 RepID=A0ABQ8CXE8_BRANA|nr:hypothetical protein HID58_021803 [Brassica napus]